MRGARTRPGETHDQYADRFQSAAQALRRLPSLAGWEAELCSRSSEGQGASGWRTITWTEPWATAAGQEWWETVARLVQLAVGDLSSVRIVFWFDN